MNQTQFEEKVRELHSAWKAGRVTDSLRADAAAVLSWGSYPIAEAVGLVSPTVDLHQSPDAGEFEAWLVEIVPD